MLNPERESSPHPLGWIVVSGDSMWPALRSGDAVLCEPVARATAGDIVVAKLLHAVVAHRVVSWAPLSVVLRGDTAACNDASVDAANVLGRVVRVRRAGVEYAIADVDAGPNLLGRARANVKRVLLRVARRLS